MSDVLWQGEMMAARAQPLVKQATQPMHVDFKDDAILQALAHYHYLTVEQVTRLFYAAGSLKRVYARMKRLADAGYCQRLMHYQRTPAKARYVYHLARKGISYLLRHGLIDERRYHPSEQTELSDRYLSHTLACNDFFIGAHLLPRQLPHVTLHDWQHEHELRRNPVRVTVAGGTAGGAGARPVSPDGWLEFHAALPDGVEQHCIVLELDRDMERQRAWREKVARLVAYAGAPYLARYGTDVITIAVVAAPRDSSLAPGRCAELVTWTAHELRALDAVQEAGLFRFTAMPPHTDPQILFTTPCWSQPFDPRPLPLIADCDVV